MPEARCDGLDSAIIVAAINAAVTIANVLIANAIAKNKKSSEREKCLADGVQCLLRSEIIHAHDKYSQKRFCPIYAKESLTRAYQAYHALGGNDVATDLYKQVMELPEREDYYED